MGRPKGGNLRDTAAGNGHAGFAITGLKGVEGFLDNGFIDVAHGFGGFLPAARGYENEQQGQE